MKNKYDGKTDEYSRSPELGADKGRHSITDCEVWPFLKVSLDAKHVHGYDLDVMHREGDRVEGAVYPTNSPHRFVPSFIGIFNKHVLDITKGSSRGSREEVRMLGWREKNGLYNGLVLEQGVPMWAFVMKSSLDSRVIRVEYAFTADMFEKLGDIHYKQPAHP